MLFCHPTAERSLVFQHLLFLMSFFTLAPKYVIREVKVLDTLAPHLKAFSPFFSPPCGIWRPGCGVAPAPRPAAPECGPAVGPVLSVSVPAAALCLEQALHPGVHHPNLLPRLLPTPHYCCRYATNDSANSAPFTNEGNHCRPTHVYPKAPVMSEFLGPAY